MWIKPKPGKMKPQPIGSENGTDIYDIAVYLSYMDFMNGDYEYCSNMASTSCFYLPRR
jgi:hypothetical protein